MIAIIPAKSQSQRCPGKNLRLLAGHPLFWHSVQYAQNEGFLPIVSTDSEATISLCRQHGIPFLREQVNDSDIAHCIRQVLNHHTGSAFALLQPTSPLRPPGLLRRMMHTCTRGEAPSAYTACPLKPIGHLHGHFLHAGRDQDTPQRFHHFDGGIVTCTRSYFEQSGRLFSNASRPFPNTHPCSLQIDTEEDFLLLEHLCTHPHFRRFLPARPRRICIISNRPFFTRDYSPFIDSCDIVIRINKMDNLDTGLTGTRTDTVVISCWQDYLSFPRAARHMETLHRARHIYFPAEPAPLTRQFCQQENFRHWAFLPPAVEQHTQHFTTCTKAIALADWLYPQAKLFFLGDTNTAARTGLAPLHLRSGDERYLHHLLHTRRLHPILEDHLPENSCRYSIPIPPEKQENATLALLLHHPTALPHEQIPLRHPAWKDTLRISGTLACRSMGGHTARILRRSTSALTLQWSHWGTETFLQAPDGTFIFSPQG